MTGVVAQPATPSGLVFDDEPDRRVNPYRLDRVAALTDAMNDAHANPAEAHAYAMVLIRGEVRGYRTAEGVRRCLWTYSPIIAAMAVHAPAAHDELLLEIVGRLDRLT